jgi:hypothetical protein
LQGEFEVIFEVNFRWIASELQGELQGEELQGERQGELQVNFRWIPLCSTLGM